MSAFFTVFSPIPLFFIGIRFVDLRVTLRWTFLAVLSNAVIVFFASGTIAASLYFIFNSIVGLGYPYLVLNRRMGPGKTILFGYLGVILLTACLVLGFWVVTRQNPTTAFHAQVSDLVHRFHEMGQQAGTDLGEWDGLSPEEIQKEMYRELPSAGFVFCLIFLFTNFMVFLNIFAARAKTYAGYDATFFKTWKLPEWLVWPTVVSGAVVLFGTGEWTGIGVNFFKIALSLYALQGLSILAFLLDHWGVKGVFRSAVYLLVLFLMLPLLLAVGFFDLWFDFRGKFRQT